MFVETGNFSWSLQHNISQVRYQVEHFTSGLQDVNNDLFIKSMPLREIVKVQFKNITREITGVIANYYRQE